MSKAHDAAQEATKHMVKVEPVQRVSLAQRFFVRGYVWSREDIDVDELAAKIAETMKCTWGVPAEGHPYHEACLHKRWDEGHGVCWNEPYEVAEAIKDFLVKEVK